jgi:hypothetical protein
VSEPEQAVNRRGRRPARAPGGPGAARACGGGAARCNAECVTTPAGPRDLNAHDRERWGAPEPAMTAGDFPPGGAKCNPITSGRAPKSGVPWRPGGRLSAGRGSRWLYVRRASGARPKINMVSPDSRRTRSPSASTRSKQVCYRELGWPTSLESTSIFPQLRHICAQPITLWQNCGNSATHALFICIRTLVRLCVCSAYGNEAAKFRYATNKPLICQ